MVGLGRSGLKDFIIKHAVNGLVLDLGSADSPYRKYFSNLVTCDIRAGDGVDVVADAHCLPFEDDKFDCIICTEVLEHLHSPAAAISEMKRILKPGGMLILTTRFVFPIHDAPNDYYRYTKYGLKFLFSDGWNIIDLRAEAGTQKTLAILIQRIALQSDFYGGQITKFLIFMLCRTIYYFPNIIKEEFFDVRKSGIEDCIMAPGYYLSVQKSPSVLDEY